MYILIHECMYVYGKKETNTNNIMCLFFANVRLYGNRALPNSLETYDFWSICRWVVVVVYSYIYKHYICRTIRRRRQYIWSNLLSQYMNILYVLASSFSF